MPAPSTALPRDAASAILVGRVWRPELSGPSVVVIREGRAVDISSHHATMTDLVEHVAGGGSVSDLSGEDIGSVDDLVRNADPSARDESLPRVLSPIDLQAIKAAGVTFAVSMLERVIEERAGGSAEHADGIRAKVTEALGGSLDSLVPGSDAAEELKSVLRREGLWSQYLEVGIGRDAEIFTKAQTLSSVGTGETAGVYSRSTWNNPEPEVAVIVSSGGTVVGATLANDVNLRDFEGRSALLLSKAKDNNASAVIGPFIRLVDDGYTVADIAETEVSLTVRGAEGFELQGSSSQAASSRTIDALLSQLIGAHHQYPDGAVLLLGTMFAPTQDRSEPGLGFTHRIGDAVTISSPRLGTLANRVGHSEDCAPWTFGVSELMRNLAARGLLGA
ncbi:fumarylacetoacetate hydrolase family protein [Paramicrobacterium humi]|uniref:fumarylacetoacetate hydrolase family protein n=1 Tax=Paramicrobacterium humi TaxID=640635 RepID=UPI000B86B8A8|nr:fumarylacetoacetate hydrolase family protein [Microbacterium humi]